MSSLNSYQTPYPRLNRGEDIVSTNSNIGIFTNRLVLPYSPQGRQGSAPQHIGVWWK